MSRNQRIALVVAALAVAVVAFVIARPGDDDDGQERAAQTTPAETRTETTREQEQTRTEAEAEPAPPRPEVTRIRLRGGTVVGGVKRVQATKGDTVRVVINADAPDEIHVHGYDIYANAAPGRPARLVFRADIEGIFEMESHVAADAGKDPLIARLVVEPA
jgi:FtsP/CotA-like multicopper oxidase with cupredoxin domain